MEELLEALIYLIVFMGPFLMFYFKRQILEFFAPQPNRPIDVQTAPINPTTVKAIQNPFLITIDHVKSTAEDGLYIQQIKSNLDRINMLVAWHVNINQFYEEFEKDVTTFLYSNTKPFLSNISKLVQLKEIHKNDYCDEIYLEMPGECKQMANINNQVKKTYPIVLILYRPDLVDIRPSDLVCSVWVIHLKDKQMTTKILFNYTKCLNNRIIKMNQIYNSDQENLCVACQVERSNLVLLPCSHNCVCSECFKRIGRNCPVCRQTIQSHFTMSD